MNKGRLEAFSDGVIAIIITITVLELKVPHGHEWTDLGPLVPVLSSYLLSFVFLSIYWNNHHHMLHAATRVSALAMWANLHLLFWLSLVPFVTGWMGENYLAPIPVALYGVVQLMAGIAYFILARALIRQEGRASPLALALGKDFKGLASIGIYAVAIPLAFVNSWIACGAYVLVALVWLCPDPRIARALEH